MNNSAGNFPLISVIIPVYNVENFLERCFSSLQRQTYKNLEIILVDDGSTDQSAGLCRSFAEQCKNVYLYQKENGGASDARNYGLDMARGEYITFVDSDDFLDVDYIQYLYALIVKYRVKMSICQHRVCYNSGKVIDYGKNGSELLTSKRCLERMLYYDTIDTSLWAKMYHRDLFRSIRFPLNNIFEDLATTYKLMMQCDSIACGYQSKYNYSLHQDSVSNKAFSSKKLSYIKVTDAVVKDIVSVYPDLIHAGLARKVRARFSVLNLMINSNEVGYKKEKSRYRNYIIKNRWKLLKNKNVLMSEKIAVILITVSFRLYRIIWKYYRRGAI